MNSFLVLILLAIHFVACQRANNSSRPPENQQMASEEKPTTATVLHVIHINGVPLQVEIAQDEESAAQGLMHRDQLPENQGMLFVFPNQRILTFWMRNTFIPLDIAFIDESGTIVDIQRMAPLDETKDYISAAPALYALEVNAGWFEKQNIRVGSKVGF